MRKLILLVLLGATTPMWNAPAFAAPVAKRQNARTWPTLSRTSNQGWQVIPVQYLLRHRGFTRDKPDFQFGPRTERAVKAFQRSKGLKVDGIVGAQTWKKLIVPLQRGSRGDAVRAVQYLLNYTGSESGDQKYSFPFDGIFGAATEKAVRITQWEEGWKVDGIVGPQTWCDLLGGEIAGQSR